MPENNLPYKIQDEPGIAEAAEGSVLQDGPNGVALTMTPDAAEMTGQHLMDASIIARVQKGERAPTETGLGRAAIGAATLIVGAAALFFWNSRRR